MGNFGAVMLLNYLNYVTRIAYTENRVCISICAKVAQPPRNVLAYIGTDDPRMRLL